ncbi:MAG: hypothetical protein Q8941_00690 [Bacteroidota bacterium]|nr:hypothetical protein [Bacteroidota bacterium]
MRTAAVVFLCFVASGYAAKSQKFSLLPQVGFENSKTNINYNHLGSFSPMGVKFSPQASLRLVYTSKHGNGFFLGAASSRSVVNFTFTDPETGMNNFTTTSGNMQVRLEGGYQFSSRPISLGNKKQTQAKNETTKHSASCSGWHCRRRNCSGNNKAQTSFSRKWVRIQPSIGMGFIPGVKTDVVTKTQNGQTSYEYRAGNWNTALIAGTGFEFGRKSTRLFTVSVNYFKGLGNLGNQSIYSGAGAKSITTNLQSSVAGWNMKVGIPFTLGSKNSPARHRRPECQQYRPATGQYRISYRCTNKN